MTSKKSWKKQSLLGGRKINAKLNSSPTDSVRIALGQMNCVVGDFNHNTSQIQSQIQDAKSKKADLILFPELVLTGYPPEDLLLKQDFVDHNLCAVQSLVSGTKDIVVITGFVERFQQNLYNAAALMANGKFLGSYRKIELPNYGVFDEKRYFKTGSSLIRFTWNQLVFGITICEDIWVVDGPGKALCQAGGVDVLLNISSSPYHAGKGAERERLIKKRAREYKTFIVYVNLVGGQDELVFDGNSLLASPQGKILARGRSFEEDLILVDLEIPIPKSSKKKSGSKTSIPIKTYRVKATAIEDKPPLPKPTVPKLDDKAEVFEALKLGTRDYIRKNGFETVAIGLSGGIDSALTAVIAAEALGPESVIGVLMPSPYSSRGSVDDARALARNLKIKTLTFPIESAMRAYDGILADAFRGTSSDLAEENLQARVRGNLLMALSNKFGWLVLTTGNKSEISVGYCTLYGDMAGGFAIIKDVPKTLVYRLSYYVNERAGCDLIPKTILEKAPSAELRLNQKDTDSLPDYDLLDAVIHEYVENDKSFQEIKKKGFAEKEIRRIIRMVDLNEYKRRQSPPGIKITPKSFGKDRRLPITNRFTHFQQKG